MVMTLVVGLLFGGACFMKVLEELKTTMKEFFVALGNNIRACYRVLFKLHQNFFLLLSCDKLSFEQICPHFPLTSYRETFWITLMLTSLFPTFTPFPRPTHAYILIIVSPKTMLKNGKMA